MTKLQISDFNKLELNFKVGFNNDAQILINDAIEKALGYTDIIWKNDKKLILKNTNNIESITISK